MFGTTIKNSTILGFAFKAITNDTRESPAIHICKKLIEEGAFLKIYDPKVKYSQIEKDLSFEKQKPQEGEWIYSNNINETFNNADAAVFLTEWEEFAFLNWQELSNKMRQPSWVFDTRSIVNIEEVKKSGIKFGK